MRKGFECVLPARGFPPQCRASLRFVYPIAAVYLDWVRSGRRLYALSEILVFLLILFVGLVYVWVKHDLEWVKKVPEV